MQPQTARAMPLNVQFAVSGIRAERQVVIRTQHDLDAFWREHAGADAPAAPPVVDFRGADVVGYLAGQKSSGGYRVSIAGVRRAGRVAVIAVDVSRPAPGEIVTLAFSSPGALRSVPKLPSIVRFEVALKTR